MSNVITAIYGGEPFLDVFIITGLFGGVCSWLTGMAMARTWRSRSATALAMATFGLGIRFLHFALFEGPLFSLSGYVADTAFLIAVAELAFQRTRTLQMTRQYFWLYAPTGPLTWRKRDQVPERISP